MPAKSSTTDSGSDAVENTDTLSQDVPTLTTPHVVAEQTALAVPAEPEPDIPAVDDPGWVETLTYPVYKAEDAEAISLDQLQLAEFYGRASTAPSAAQPHVTRLEDFLRSHAVGGSNRNPEGFYGPKTKALVNVAYETYLFKEGNGVVGRDLIDALRTAGATVTT